MTNQNKSMKKIAIAPLLILLLPITINAQKSEATLIFKDGSVLKGLGRLTNANTIRFRQTKKDKKQIYTFKEVDTLKVHYDYGTTTYIEAAIENREEPKVLEVIMVSNSIAYYHRYNYFTAMGGTSTHYYLKRKSDNQVIHFGSNQLGTLNFKKVATTFFSDSEELVQAIEEEKYGRYQLKEIIEVYEEKCGR